MRIEEQWTFWTSSWGFFLSCLGSNSGEGVALKNTPDHTIADSSNILSNQARIQPLQLIIDCRMSLFLRFLWFGWFVMTLCITPSFRPWYSLCHLHLTGVWHNPALRHIWKYRTKSRNRILIHNGSCQKRHLDSSCLRPPTIKPAPRLRTRCAQVTPSAFGRNREIAYHDKGSPCPAQWPRKPDVLVKKHQLAQETRCWQNRINMHLAEQQAGPVSWRGCMWWNSLSYLILLYHTQTQKSHKRRWT